jgi:hypothetical protein
MFVASYLASCAASAAGYCACWTATGCTKAMMKRSARVAYRWGSMLLTLSSALPPFHRGPFAGTVPRFMHTNDLFVHRPCPTHAASCSS